MTPKQDPMDPSLERALTEIRTEEIPDPVVAAAAARVWARLSQESDLTERAAEHIRSCADFQSLMPDFRAGRLPEARALLLRDHLHECIACRRAFDGKPAAGIDRAVPMPVRSRSYSTRWALAAGVIVAGGLVVWFSVIQSGPHAGHAMVQAVNGNLYSVSATGLRLMKAGDDLPDGMEIRTAGDSDASLLLRDGSHVEMRERSGFSTSQTGSEITVHLDRGSLIVQAAHRRSGHFYVSTADCRVAVTGTVFGISSGVKGSRVSVLEGEVRVSHDNQEQILHPGDQTTTSASLAPATVQDDLGWTRNPTLRGQLQKLHARLARLPLPQLRYSSRLLGLLPASTVFFASIPNLAEYLGEAETVFRQQAAESPELRSWLAGPGAAVEPVMEKLRAANEYLGNEIVVFGTSQTHAPVFLAEVKRDGLSDFLKKQGLPLAYATRPGLVLFSPSREALDAALDSTFQKTDFYNRIADVYRQGAGLLLCADLAGIGPHAGTPGGARYLIAEQKQAGGKMESRATVAFDGPRTGAAAWLAPPSPMGALDYVSPDATFAADFAVRTPAAILQEAATKFHLQGLDAPNGLASTLGGELAVAMDGPVFPVPSWKLVAEVYDPARFQAAVQQFVEQYDHDATAQGGKPLRTSEENADGRTDYLIASADPNPLTEIHYTFANGYLIAAPTRALLARALQAKASGAGITRTTMFTSMIPRDHYADFSAVVYQNLGNTLAPLAGLLGALAPSHADAHAPIPNMSNLKPFLIAAYGEPDRITIASNGDVPGMSLNNFLSGSVLGLAANGLQLGQFAGTSQGRSSSR